MTSTLVKFDALANAIGRNDRLYSIGPWSNWRPAIIAFARFGSKGDMCGAKSYVRLAPKADMCGATGDVRFGP
jgi:hypothetical protein